MKRSDPDYINYESFYMANFSLLPAEAQTHYFYIKNFKAVDPKDHYDRPYPEDESYNYDIINPIYQMFCSAFLAHVGLSNMIEDMLEDFQRQSDVWDKFYNIYPARIDPYSDEDDESYWRLFFNDLSLNTSLNGFIDGPFWKGYRSRIKDLLENTNLIDANISYEKPIKFSGFRYPTDFDDYNNGYPYLSHLGQWVSPERWAELRERTFNLYKDAELNF
jgi:hypothetical protein